VAELRTHCVNAAVGPTPLLYVYNRSNNLVADPWALTNKATPPVFSSVVPGGFETCQFVVPIHVHKDLALKEAYRLAVRCGIGVAWEGRIADLERKAVGSGTASVLAYGGWEHLGQRRTTDEASAGEFSDDVLRRVLLQASLISSNYDDFLSPEFDIEGLEWTRADLQTIVKALMAAGDDQTPPREWFLNVWESEELPATGAIAGLQVSASVDDAQDKLDDSDNSWVALNVRIGSNAAAPYTTGLIFRNVTIPRYSVISAATVELYSAGAIGATDPVRVKIYCEPTGSPDDFSVSWPRTRAKTVAYRQWDVDWPAAGNWVTSNDFTDAVQEAVNSPLWHSGDSLSVILASDAVSDIRKQIQAWDAVGAEQAKLNVNWAPPTGMTMAFHSEFIPRIAATVANTEYLIYADDVEGELGVVPTTEELFNSVVAKYGAFYTAVAEDTDSINLYDKRENDPDALDAGDTATLAQAENVRDAYLALHKDPLWRANDITVRRLRDRWGNFVNLGMVRAGCIIRLVDFSTFEYDAARCFFVVRTEYDAGTGLLTLSPELPPDTLDIMIQRLQ